MEEDEDVIFEGSALFSHLQDVGLTDFEVASTKNYRLYAGSPTINSELCRKEHEENLIVKIWTWFMIHSGLSEFKRNFVRRLAIKIIKSKLLEENDLLSLEHLSQTVEHLTCNQEIFLFENCSNGSPFSRLKEYYVLFLSLAFGFLALLISNCNYSLCLAIAAIAVIIILCCYFLKRSYENDFDYLIGLLHIMEEATKVIMKIRKTINEINILGKSLGKYNSCGEDSLETCLREGVDSLTECFSMMYIESHLEINKRKLPVEWGSIKELHNDRFHHFEFTSEQNYFTMKLNWFMNQTSAFLTEMLLHIERDYKECLKYNFTKIISAHHALAIDTQLQSIVKLHKLASNYWFDEKPLNPDLKLYSRLQRKSLKVNLSEVTSCLDSLYVHSRLAVNHIILLKNIFEENPPKKGDKGNAEILNNITKECDGIKCQFLSSMGCLEEVCDRAQRLFGEANQPTVGIQPLFTENTNISKDLAIDNSHIRIIEAKDSVPMDEVFEAVVGDNSNNANIKEDKCNWKLDKRLDSLTRKKQRERCKRVLQEIQPILQQRREMWNEREQIALERKNQGFNTEPTVNVVNEPTSIESTNIIEEIPVVTVMRPICADKTMENIIDAPLHCKDDYDSDEERLLLYKRVKKELDEDEARRGVDEDLDEDDMDLQSENFKSPKNFLCKTKCTPIFNLNTNCDNNISDISFKKQMFENDESITVFPELNSANGNHKGDNYNNGNYIVSDRQVDLEVTDENIFYNFNLDTGNINAKFNSLDQENLNLESKLIIDISSDNKVVESCSGESSSLSSSSSPSLISTGHDMSGPSSIELTSSSLLSSSLTYPSLPSSLCFSPLDSPLLKEDIKIDPLLPTNVSQPLIRPHLTPSSLIAETSLAESSGRLLEKAYSTEKSSQDSSSPKPNKLDSADLLAETFACGNNSSDEESHPIDWSTCGYPSSRRLPPELCSIPCSVNGRTFGGFNPLLSSELQLKNKFSMEEEIFGGVGEGEEELSEDNSDLEENSEDNSKT